ncbi:MAG: 4Fe-4S binding protein [Thermoplasmata archaeon]
MDIAIASGKGGTGKTLIATNLAKTFAEMGKDVNYLDCDVEEPDGHLFLKPEITENKEITLRSPESIDEERCIKCGKCVDACKYNAIALVNDNVLFFPELCHVCGACSLVCPTDAIIESERKIGDLKKGNAGEVGVAYAALKTGEGGMSPRLIQAVRKENEGKINIIDAPPGTACPAVESISGVDLIVLVSDPTPFGVNDLKLSVDMCRGIGIEPVVIVNRAEYKDDRLKEYCEEENLEIIGEIPDDREIAETYSKGDMIVEELDEYKGTFKEIARTLGKMSNEDRTIELPAQEKSRSEKVKKTESKQKDTSVNSERNKELVVISGKGGTGKTSLMGSFAALAEDPILSDCDVDAADLHLLTDPEIKESGLFSGGYTAEIDQEKCTNCGLCYEECRFHAIVEEGKGDEKRYRIDQLECEGCGVCDIVCPEDAVDLEEAVNGEWFVSETRFGGMSHAKLGIAEENTGRLVTLVRENAEGLVSGENKKTLIDGAPGTGCPVIASLTGSDYALVVTEPTVSGIHDMERVLEVADHFGIKSGIVVNKADLNEEMTEKIEEIAEERGVELLGKIPYDTVFIDAQMEALSVVEYVDEDDPVSIAIKEIWKKFEDRIGSTSG